MKTIDALNLLSISGENIGFETVKKAYCEASKKYHPDINPAGLAMMQAVNEAWETLQSLEYPLENREGDEYLNYGEELSKALNKIIHILGLDIEVCGSWVWVSGSTKEYKDTLKGAGFRFSGKKKMWYFRPEGKVKRYYRGTSGMGEIRSKYGSQKVRTSTHYQLVP